MTSRLIFRAMMGFYVVLFFGFLFGPLVVMTITAFNTPTYPQAWPFEGFTIEWFTALLRDRAMMEGIRASLLIGLLVVLLSVPLGLAGALMMTQIDAAVRPIYYVVVISPVLTPGVIIGISTVIFWRDVINVTGADRLYDGILLTTLGQATFISAYCMLIFLARLQRFDRTQQEAALDLGATPFQVFRHILLPFLRPAIVSAAVIAFLSSFENYNTTTFAILAEKTLTTVLAGRVRSGTTPSVSALAVVIIGITVVGAVLYGIAKVAEERRADRRRAAAARAEREEEMLLPAASQAGG